MGLYDASLGAMLIATWINSMLWILEIVQVIRIWKNYRKDTRMIRGIMLACLTFDTACTCAACATVYLYCITNWGNLPALALQYWTFPLYIITTTMTAATVQSFLAYRFWSLTRNRALAAVFCILILTATAGGTYTMFTIFLFPSFAERFKNVVSASLWLSATAATDISLAIGLVWKLRSMSTSFRSTQTMLSRLSTSALQSGMVTSVIAAAVLITFLQNNRSNIPVALNFFLGRLYSHTLLYSLSLRKSLRAQASTTHTSSDRDPSEGAVDLSNIQVSRTVHVDRSEDTSRPTPLKSAPSAPKGYGYATDKKLAASVETFVPSPQDNFMEV